MRVPTIVGPINHVLRANTWASERLAPFAGRVACIHNPPFTVMILITTEGEAANAASDAAPDVTITLTPGLSLRLWARDVTVWNDIKAEGNAEFAAALNHIARNLRWDIEEDLSRMFGDIAAHRMVETGRKLDNWGRQGAENIARSFAEYWTEERPLIASRADVAQFTRDVDALRDDVARLEKRVERLQTRDNSA